MTTDEQPDERTQEEREAEALQEFETAEKKEVARQQRERAKKEKAAEVERKKRDAERLAEFEKEEAARLDEEAKNLAKVTQED